MKKRVAVMDLGTNTFHLLIAEGDADNFEVLKHETVPVKLGEGGINKGYILEAPFERGVTTMKAFGASIHSFDVQGIKTLATSALRNAANGKDFIEAVKAQAGIEITVIDGETEANYIYLGVKASGCLSEEKSLIIDIGGGSVEFIICNVNQVFWKHSFEIGAARLMDKFHKTDPINQESIEQLHHYLDEALDLLFQQLKKHQINSLVGSSGSFETFAELTEYHHGREIEVDAIKKYEFNCDILQTILQNIIESTHQQRAANPRITPVRVDMVVVAAVLTRYCIAKVNPDHLLLSTYALKEGALAELMV
ncbi:exopolyphosphatase [Mucilaginibacter sp. RS28]|uniref:Exopolyphosphatase n=1 Tax=Mucilaginibacter straminoryzae TaxID=2932774 RepID=A0A9X2B8X6_9SPHI|nr:exopolyphosphatase [Mucilaginibacter straminoryzae]MCJ8209881.1 exopolyphosphatase [Mucilaginibacter straminoryzae]